VVSHAAIAPEVAGGEEEADDRYGRMEEDEGRGDGEDHGEGSAPGVVDETITAGTRAG